MKNYLIRLLPRVKREVDKRPCVHITVRSTHLVGTVSGARSSATRFPWPTPFPPQTPPPITRLCSPASQVLWGRLTSCRSFRVASLPSLSDTTLACVILDAPIRTQIVAWSCSPGLSSRDLRGNDRTSQVPGRPPPSVCTCSSTPARRLLQTNERMCATIRNNRTAPAKGTTKALANKDFRSSITWLSDSLSTLRSDGRPPPRKTRFRLPVRLYRTGFPPAGSLSKVSDSCHVMSCQSSPSAKLLGAIPFSSSAVR